MTAVDPGRLALAAAEAAHALDHGWPHTPTADELADLYRSDEQSAYPKHDALQKIADGLERDRREPDKVLCYVASLRRLAVDIRDGRL